MSEAKAQCEIDNDQISALMPCVALNNRKSPCSWKAKDSQLHHTIGLLHLLSKLFPPRNYHEHMPAERYTDNDSIRDGFITQSYVDIKIPRVNRSPEIRNTSRYTSSIYFQTRHVCCCWIACSGPFCNIRTFDCFPSVLYYCDAFLYLTGYILGDPFTQFFYRSNFQTSR